MAFQQPAPDRKKLLEQLEEQKKRLRGVPSTAVPSTSVSSNSMMVGPGHMMPGPQPGAMPLPPDAAGMSSQQRTALQYAHANSHGYFITQDSSFGNLILPVLPRYSEK